MRFAIAVLLTLAATTAAAQSTFDLQGFLTLRGVSVDAQRSWAAGGLGKFAVGSDNGKERRFVDVETAQVGFEWTPLTWLTVHADGIARREPSENDGSRGGLLQAYADVFTEKWRVRAGTFWLPTSRENVDPLWTSRYTMTFSALNSWIGQEVRPIGLDLQYSPNFYVTAGVTAFRGNDTMGTVLADRGWSFGDRLSVYGEDLPRPWQDAPTTRPIGEDLDDENGYSARLRLQIPERALLQLTHIDNRAPHVQLLKGEEPWHTKFNILGLQSGHSTSPRVLAAEWARGSTTIFFTGGSAQIDFDTVYLLASQKRGRDRFTTRIERFSTHDHSREPDDPDRESGRAVTITWLRDLSENLRLGLEYVRVDGERAEVSIDGSTISLELRYAF